MRTSSLLGLGILSLGVLAGSPCATGAGQAGVKDSLDRSLEQKTGVTLASRFPWKRRIHTTFFWIGNNRNNYTTTTNFKSAWDGAWSRNYGGDDNPNSRQGFRPKNFLPGLNPFYIALPFNDVAFPDKARRLIPWFKKMPASKRYVSQCKGKWVAVHFKGRFCFATWEDVGPFNVDHAEYVFGNDRPRTPTGAGLDVSPAVRDYLGLSGRDLTDWRFVEDHEVPTGPWIDYGEKALMVSLLKNRGSVTAPGVSRKDIREALQSDKKYNPDKGPKKASAPELKFEPEPEPPEPTFEVDINATEISRLELASPLAPAEPSSP